MSGIVAGSKKVVAVFYGIEHHSDWNSGCNFGHGTVHIIIKYCVGGVNGHILFCVFHQMGQGVEYHGLLAIDGGGVGDQSNFAGGNSVRLVIGQGAGAVQLRLLFFWCLAINTGQKCWIAGGQILVACFQQADIACDRSLLGHSFTIVEQGGNL